MLSFQNAISDQGNLANLCADRRNNTEEIFKGNAFYGDDYVLRMYSGLPAAYRLKVVIPHGVALDPSFIWSAERAAFLPAVFCYQVTREEVYARQTQKRIIRGAAPFVYARELIKDQLPSDRLGLLFFPSHSTHHLQAHANYEELADILVTLPQKYMPISVCIYWRDYNLGHHKPFMDRGIRVVSAGHVYDKYFLFRLVYLLSMHKFASGNNFGSHMFYSTLSGCEYFHFEGYEPVISGNSERPNMPVGLAVQFRELFRKDPSLFRKEEQRKCTEHYLGTNNLLRPTKLRRTLLSAELLDKTRIAYQNGLIIPAFFQRLIVRLKSYARLKY